MAPPGTTIATNNDGVAKTSSKRPSLGSSASGKEAAKSVTTTSVAEAAPTLKPETSMSNNSSSNTNKIREEGEEQHPLDPLPSSTTTAAVAATLEAPKRLEKSSSFPSKPSVLLGTIKGHRSESGTMTLTGSFDADGSSKSGNSSSSHRLRDRTQSEPGWMQPLKKKEMEEQQQQQQHKSAATTNQAPSAAALPEEDPHSADANSNPKNIPEEEDEELKLAMAMALAIQSNPNLTPDEYHQLMAQQQQQQPAAAAPAAHATTAPALIPGRLSSLFAATNTNDAGNNKLLGTLRDRARGRFSEIRTNHNNLAEKEAAPTNISPSLETTTTARLPFRKSPEALPPEEEKEATQTPATTVVVEDGSHSVDETTTTTTAFPASAAAAAARAAPLVVTEAAAAAWKTAAATAPAELSSPLHSPTVTSATATARTALAGRASMFQKLLAPAAGGGSSSSRSGANFAAASLPPRLTAVAWKRRGGMGKYSTTSAWERRRIALQGNRLLYYSIVRGEEEDQLQQSQRPGLDLSDSGEELGFLQPPLSTTSEASQKKGGNGGGGGGGNWFETTTSNWTSTPSDLGGGGNSTTEAPRGFIDLAKEKATVHAAFGHSGAPTPFALSIKIKGETKWKLCFDRHATEMEWLSAITDVVVQTSVDTYNASLLAAADPANHFDYALFHPPMTADGAATSSEAPGATTTGKGHRLWMLEPYRVASHHDLESLVGEEATAAEVSERSVTSRGMEAEQDDVLVPAAMMTTTASLVTDEAADAAARVNAQEEATKTYVIPEENLRYALAAFNFAVFFARSSISIDSFWYLVVFANFAIFWCLAEQPCWKSILKFVRAVPTIAHYPVQQTRVPHGSTAAAVKSVPPGIQAGAVLAPAAAAKKPNYTPAAGCSAVMLDEPTDVPKNENGEMFAGWRPMPGETLAVRSHGYSVSKSKVPSPGELYECVKVDIFESPNRYPDMGPRVKLPDVSFNDGDTPKTWRCPDIFIVSIALPTDTPKLGRSSSDGSGYTVTIYFRMKQDTRDILRRVTADDYDPADEKQAGDVQKSKVNAARLLEEWIRRAPTDPKFLARFKVVPNAHNLKEIGMPGWISKYNGKPFLIKRAGVTGFLHIHPELSCAEFDVSLHPFPYLAKQGICFMKESYFKRVLVTFGFVIEGRADDELPECLIGCTQLCYPDPQYAIQAADFFAGTAPRSF